MKKKYLNKLLSLFVATLFSTVLLAQTPCSGITVTTPTIDVRGNTNLCAGGSLELCPLIWGYSNYQWYKDGIAFSTNACITITAAGSYTLAAQDGSGCWSSQTSPVTAVGGGVAPSTPTISTTSATSFCSNSSATLTSSSSTGNQWYKDGVLIGGATAQNYQTNQSGVYTVVATSCAQSSSPSNTITLTVTTSPSVYSISGNNNLCIAQTSQLTNSTSGGTWTSSDNAIATVNSAGLVTAVAAGSAVITYTVANGACTASTTLYVNVASNTAPVLDVRGNTDLCAGGNLELCPSVWGFSSFQWNKDGVAFSTNGCINITTAGSYTLSGQNGNGCWTLTSSPVVVTGGAAPSTPTISTTSATSFCSNTSATLTSSSSTGNQWYKDGILIGGATSQSYVTNESGVYTVVAISCGTSSSASNAITLTVTTSPTVSSITGNNNICVAQTSQLLNATSGGTWTSSNNAIATVSSTGLISAVSAGNDTITYSVTNGSCTSSATITVNVASNAAPVVDVRGNTDLCAGGSLELCPLVWGFSNYQWNKDGVAFSTNACITITTPGSYVLNGQTGNGCWALPSTAVVVTGGAAPATPTISTLNPISFCSNTSATLTSSATTGNQWYKDAVLIGGATSQNYVANQSGVYTVIVTACGASSAASNAITLTVTTSPTVSSISGNNNICVAQTSQLSNTTAGGTWTSSNNAIATVSATGLVTAVSVGNDTITYTVTNGSCTASTTITINVASNAAPVVDVRGNTNLCAGGTLELCPTVWGFSNYQWNKDGVAFSTNACITITTPGSYVLNGQTGNGCWALPSTPVVVTGGAAPATPTISTLNPTSFCSNTSATLTSTSTIGNQWYKDGVLIGGATSQNYVTNQSGVYTVIATYCGASSAASNAITLTVTATPTVASTTGTNNICVAQTSQLANTTVGGTWTSSNTAIATVSATGLVTVVSAGNATITYTVTNGSCTATATTTITAASNAAPVVDVRGNTDLCVAGTLELCPTAWGYTSYQWNKDGAAFSTNSCITITTPGSYVLSGITSSGCTALPSTPVVVTGGAAPATPTISTTSPLSFCSNTPATLTSTSTIGNKWYKDGVLISGATAQTYVANQSGVYTVIVTNCGASSAASNAITLTVSASPTVSSITGTNNLCVAQTSQLSNATVGGSWASSNAAIATISVTGLVTAISAGNTTITYTVTSGSCTATATTNVSVNIATTPIIAVTGSTTICGSATTQLCPSTWGASNYQWFRNGVAFSTNACISVSTAGSYTLQTTSGVCTSPISAATIMTLGTPPAATTISAGGSTTICSGSSVALTSTAAANYQWNLNGNPISGATSATYNATANGSYTVSVSGCGSTASNAIVVTTTPSPVVDNINGVSTLCNGSTTTYTNTTAGGTWSSSNTSVATIDAAGLITTLAAGSTTISYTVTNGTCTTVKTKVFTVFATSATPTISPRSSTTLCAGSTVQMCPLVWGYSNYQWFKDGVLFSTNSCITTSVAGAYTLIGQNGAGCWSNPSAAVTVVVNPVPTVVPTTGATSVCVGSNITLANTSSIPSGGSSAWSSTIGRASVVASTGVVTGTSGGNANIRYTVTNSFGCSSFVDYAVTSYALPGVPTIAFASGYPNPQGPGGFCTNRTFGLLGIPSGGVWSSTGVGSITAAGVVSTGATAGPASVTYTFTNVNGCSSFRTIPVNVVPCALRGVNINNSTITNDTKFTLYPNPCTSFFNITTKKVVGESQIIITDITGKQYLKQALSIGNNRIETDNLPAGTYIVSILNNNEMLREKLIIQ